MRRNAVKIIGVIGVLLLVTAIALPIRLGYKTYRQNSLDRDLIASIKHKDTVGVRRLLTEGASANAIAASTPQSLWQCIVAAAKRAFHRQSSEPRSGYSALTLAVQARSSEIVGMLLDAGATDVNARFRTGMKNPQDSLSLLCCAAFRHDFEIATELIQHGADVNEVSYLDVTPLQAVVIGDNSGFTDGTIRCLTLLVQHGARINALDDLGRTLLMEASAISSPKSPAIISFLINHGALVNMNGKYGTALSSAAYLGNDAAILLLLHAGADPNLCGPDGVTPFMRAVAKCGPATVKALLDKGANVNHRTRKGHTALDLAIHYNRTAAIRLLRKYGCRATGKPFAKTTAFVEETAW